MPPSASATVTGKTGPGNTITAIALPNIKAFHIDIPRQVLTVEYYQNGPQRAEFDYQVTTTLTDTITGATLASVFVVS